jgi:hypothetical protein
MFLACGLWGSPSSAFQHNPLGLLRCRIRIRGQYLFSGGAAICRGLQRGCRIHSGGRWLLQLLTKYGAADSRSALLFGLRDQFRTDGVMSSQLLEGGDQQ